MRGSLASHHSNQATHTVTLFVSEEILLELNETPPRVGYELKWWKENEKPN